MLARLIAFSLKNAPLVLIVSAVITALAAYQVPRMPVDVFPELNAPTVVLLSEAGGLSADEVEQYVSFPLETAVNGLPGVRRGRRGSAVSPPIVYGEVAGGPVPARGGRDRPAGRAAGPRRQRDQPVHRLRRVRVGHRHLPRPQPRRRAA